MMEFVQITAQYSNAVLVAILPYVSDFAHRLNLPVPNPVTPIHVIEFKCDPRKGQIGGLLTLTNGFCFAFLEGHVSSYRSPKSYFSLQDPDRIPEFYGPVSLREKDALAVARDAIKRLGYTEEEVRVRPAPKATRPEKIGASHVARYRFQWLDSRWGTAPAIAGVTPALLDIEVDASTGQIQMLSLAGRNLRRTPPQVSVSPPALAASQQHQKGLSGGRKTAAVSPQYAAAFLGAILPQLSEFAGKVGLQLRLPLGTNDVDLSQYHCRLLDGQPMAQLYLMNGDRFYYNHGRVSDYYAHDAYHKFPEDGRLEDFLGKVNITTNEAISLCESTIRSIGYKAKLPKAVLGTVTHLGGQELTRCVFYWFRPGENSNFATFEVDMQNKAIKAVYLEDSSLWRDPPEVAVPALPATNAPPEAPTAPRTNGLSGRIPHAPEHSKIVWPTQAYSAAFLKAILPDITGFANKASLLFPLPVTTNDVDMSQYLCVVEEGCPGAQVYLKNGDRFNYEHGRIVAFYAHDAYLKFPNHGKLEDFLGKINMTTNQAIALCERTIHDLGYKPKLPKVWFGGRTYVGTNEFSRYLFRWQKPGVQSEVASIEIDMESKTIKSLCLTDPSLWHDSPKIDVPVLPTTNAAPEGTK